MDYRKNDRPPELFWKAYRSARAAGFRTRMGAGVLATFRCVARGACVAAALNSLASRLASLLRKSQYLMSGAFFSERLTPLFVASQGDEYILRNIQTNHGSYATHKDSFSHTGLMPLVIRLGGLCRCGSDG